MCLALYLHTNDKLQVSEWSEENPKVWIQLVTEENDRGAFRWTDKQDHIYYIGGYQGCGCGWSPTNEWDEPEEIESKKKDRIELVNIFKQIDWSSSWFVICWEGDQGEELSNIKILTQEDILNSEFEIEELQKYKLA